MNKGFDLPSNKHLGNSHDYWKAPQANSKQIVVQPLTWIKIDRDENGYATEECLDKMQESVPFVAATQVQHQFVYHLIKNERDFIVYKETIYSGRDVTHYLPIPKLEV